MEITPNPEKLASARLTPEELQAAFGTALLSAASVDCGTVIDPQILHAEFGESLAANLAFARMLNPEMARLYAIVLSDYLRFCRMYIKTSLGVSEGGLPPADGFDRQVYRSLTSAIRAAYQERKKEMFNVRRWVENDG